MNATKITDGVIYRIGSGPAKKVNLDSGRRLSVSVIPGQFRSRQHDRLVLAAAIGDTNDCALVSSSVHAVTYYPGGQPPS